MNGQEEKVYYDQSEKIPYPGDLYKVALDLLIWSNQFLQKELPKPNFAQALPETPSKRPEKVHSVIIWRIYNQ